MTKQLGTLCTWCGRPVLVDDKTAIATATPDEAGVQWTLDPTRFRAALRKLQEAAIDLEGALSEL